MGFKVLAPCIVTSEDRTSAKHYRQIGEVIDIPGDEQAENLVAGGFVEKTRAAVPEENKSEDKSEDSKPADKPESKAKQKPGA